MSLEPSSISPVYEKLLSSTPEVLVSYILSQQEKLNSQEEQLNSQEQQLNSQEQQLNSQEQQLNSQEQRIHSQEKQIQQLQTVVEELRAQLSKDSSNSGKPPSSDGLKAKTKTRSQRATNSGKKRGGQKGRKSKNLSQVANPDKVVDHSPACCEHCATGLEEVQGSCAEQRQVFEIPKPKVEVTEHRVLTKVCPGCGKVNRGSFPEDVRGHVQYGARACALAAYLAHQHYLPVERVCEVFRDLTGISFSAGSCAKVDKRLMGSLEAFETGLKEFLKKAKVLHLDETGIRCEKKLHWIHVASTSAATFYLIHPKRGKEGSDAGGILPDFRGVGVHDNLSSYFNYKEMEHALCNAHHLRELDFIHEQYKEIWAKEYRELLLFGKVEREKLPPGTPLPERLLKEIEKKQEEILESGFAYHATLEPLERGKRGRQKQRDGKNLLDRLRSRRDNVLRFLYDPDLPFTNNQAEQDLRMVKLKAKVSGCFRAFSGGEIFCRIRSYLSTARKQGWDVWNALICALQGKPFLLASG